MKRLPHVRVRAGGAGRPGRARWPRTVRRRTILGSTCAPHGSGRRPPQCGACALLRPLQCKRCRVASCVGCVVRSRGTSPILKPLPRRTLATLVQATPKTSLNARRSSGACKHASCGGAAGQRPARGEPHSVQTCRYAAYGVLRDILRRYVPHQADVLQVGCGNRCVRQMTSAPLPVLPCASSERA